MKNRIIKMALSAICLAGILATAASARADATYTLGTGNTAISGYTGPYGTVDVSLNGAGTIATITFTANAVGGWQYLFGDGGSVDVNVNATSWTLGTITGTAVGTGFTPGAYSSGGSQNVDGFGTFNQTIDDFDGFSHSAGTVSFTLTHGGSGTWSSATDVLTANAGGSFVAAHIFVTTNSPSVNSANGALATGFAANGSPVPDGGATIALLGFALLGVGALRRKFGKN